MEMLVVSAFTAVACAAIAVVQSFMFGHIQANLERLELDVKRTEATLADARRQADDARQKLAACDARLQQAGFYADGAP